MPYGKRDPKGRQENRMVETRLFLGFSGGPRRASTGVGGTSGPRFGTPPQGEASARSRRFRISAETKKAVGPERTHL